MGCRKVSLALRTRGMKPLRNDEKTASIRTSELASFERRAVPTRYAGRIEHLSDHLKRRPYMISSKPAILWKGPRLSLFYPAACCGGKLVFVRQLRGPHFSTCP